MDIERVYLIKARDSMFPAFVPETFVVAATSPALAVATLLRQYPHLLDPVEVISRPVMRAPKE